MMDTMAPEVSRGARLELGAAITLGLAALILTTIYITALPTHPPIAYLVLTAAAVSAVVAVLLVLHRDLARRLDRNHQEQRYQLELSTMIRTAEAIEAQRSHN